MKLITLVFLTLFCGAVIAEELNNPNKLKDCPREQYAWIHDCWGIETYETDDQYIGEFKEGAPDGHGTYYHLSDNEFKGNKYVGQFRNGLRSGYGTYTTAAGDKYVGEFKYGNFHGKGTYVYANGNKYIGEFKDGQMHGLGSYYFLANDQFKGDRYIGEYEYEKYSGRGRYLRANGAKSEGIWEEGKFIREAKVDLPRFDNFTDDTELNNERHSQKLSEERRRIEEEKRQERTENRRDTSQDKQTTFFDSRRRLALVIGNAAYKNSPLRNPTNDADLISKALSSSGFIVSHHDNLTYAKMREVVRTFGEKLNQGDVGLFYFSGHAVQYRGKNYLLPINEDLKHADEIPSTAMDIDFVLAKMETAKNDLNIVILDACRNNPLGSESRNLDRGLRNINAAKGTFIAFATSPGNVALDGTGRNSPYTKNLAQAILKGGLALEQVFKEVRRNVISETNSQQVPWENSSILGDFYFK